MRWKPAVVLGTVVAVLSGCAGTSEPTVTVPVVVAEPVPLEGTGLTPPPSASPSPSPPDRSAAANASPEPARDASPEPAGPSSADAAAFVNGDVLPDVTGVEHVVVDLDGDAWPEVVMAGVRERVGVVHVAWWTGGGYEVMASGTAGPGRDVTDLRAADINDDGWTELSVAIAGDGLRSLALWSVLRRGHLTPLEAVGGCNNGSHVYGVTSARLAAQTEGPAEIVANCDESPLPVADWSQHRWVWEDGAYRHEKPFPPGPPDDRDDGPGQGGGQGGGNDGGGGQGGDNDGGNAGGNDDGDADD